MSEDIEKGFLSQKFEDWSSEPIPNGWSKINAIIEEDRLGKNRKPFWFALGAVLLLTGSVITYFGNHAGLLSSNKKLSGEVQPEYSQSQLLSSPPVQNSPRAIPEKITAGKSVPSFQSKIEEGNSIVRNSMAFSPGPKSSNRNSSNTGQVSSTIGLVAASDFLPASANVLDLENQSDQSLETGVLAENATGSEHFITTNPEHKEAKNGSLPGFVSEEKGTFSQEEIALLETKLSRLIIPSLSNSPMVSIVKIEREFPITKPVSKLTFSIGTSFGYAPRVIEINQDQALSRMVVSNTSQGIQSGFGDIGFSVQHEIKPWIRSFASLRLGFLRHSVSITETSKIPTGYQMTSTDGENFSMVPIWSNQTGNFQQEVYYSNIEFGLNPILFPSRQSGPFASAVVWVALKQSIQCPINGATDGLESQTENVALSYRLGYQHVFSQLFRAEIFTSGMPDKIMANSRGLSIKPQLIGLGIHYLLH